MKIYREIINAIIYSFEDDELILKEIYENFDYEDVQFELSKIIKQLKQMSKNNEKF